LLTTFAGSVVVAGVVSGLGSTIGSGQASEPGRLAGPGGPAGARERAPSLGCDWSTEFSIGDLDDASFGLAVYDDGTGPALYAAGSFRFASGVRVDGVARWDGTGWAALAGPGGFAIDGTPYALAVFDDGTGSALYVGGTITAADGVPVHNIVRWDGTTWSPLPGIVTDGVDGPVSIMTVWDDGHGPGLFVGGEFVCAGGVAVNNIARWDGAGWLPLSGPAAIGTNGWIGTLAVHDDGSGPSLYAGGNFSIAGGLTARNVARWDGHAWWPLADSLGNGTDAEVATLAVYDDGSGPALYVAGDFNWAGGQYAASIARWDGSAWSPVSSFPQYYDIGWILSLAAHDDGSGPALYAAGFFDFIGGIDAYSIARWDGVSWSGVGGLRPFGGMPVMEALVSYDAGGGPVLVAAGDFNTAGGRTAHGLAQWDGTEWWPVVGPNGVGTDGGVRSLAVVTDGARPILVAGGVFEHAGGVETHNIARWDGDRWSGLAGPLATGTDGWVETIAGFDDGTSMNIFAGGLFGSAGGLASARIGQWTSSSGALFADDFESGGPSAWSVIVDGRNGSDRADIDARQVGVAALPASSARVSRGRQ
jgi:hypothetical protein